MAKKSKDGKKGAGKKNAKQIEEEENLLFDTFLTDFRKHAQLITGTPPPANIFANLKGPADEKGAEDVPGYYVSRKWCA